MLDKLVNRRGLIVYIIFSIVYGYIFIFNYVLTYDYTFTRIEFDNNYSLFLKLSLMGGLFLSFHVLFLFKPVGRFLGILSLVFVIFIHIYQLFIAYYVTLAIIFIIIDLFLIYILSTPFIEGYLLSSSFVNLIWSKKAQGIYSKNSEVYLNILVYLLIILAIINIILAIFYKVIFVLDSIVILIFPLLLCFTYLSISLFLYSREARVIPYSLYFFIFLLFLVFYRYFLLPEPYYRFYNLESFIRTASFSVLIFAVFDMLFVILNFIVGFLGLIIFLANRRVISLFKNDEIY